MRTRTHPAIIRYALYLYFSSRGFRLADKSLSPINRSHVAIWKWVQKYSGMADRYLDSIEFEADKPDYAISLN